MVDGSISSHLDDRLGESKERVDALTPEDIAWVDSCLIKEIPNISDGNWHHMKDALMEILSLHPENIDYSAAAYDNFQGGSIDIDMLPFENDEPTFPTGSKDDLGPFNESGIATDDTRHRDNIKTSPSLSFRQNPSLPTYNDEVENGKNAQTGPSFDLSETESGSPLLSFSGNPFLPSYNDEVEKRENDQTGPIIDSSETESEPPITDIFRVWDLNLPAVEDELDEQLNKALSEGSAQSVPSKVDNFSVLEAFKEELLDDLINSISDLSLERNN